MILTELSAAEAAVLIAAGDVSSEDLVRTCIARIIEREPQVRAWAAINFDNAIHAAREADKVRQLDSTRLGPLHGVPFGVKDVINTAELPTQYNSAIYRGHRPGGDAPIVMTLRAAGGIVLGKTETVEFAADGRNPMTRNPHDLSRSPGGSSSGSAAAVADLMVPIALGTQTGGSLIRPAAYCGVYGLKPTHGTVSTEGIKLISQTLDTVGWYARSVEDLSLVAMVLELSDRPIPSPREPRVLRIGVCKTPYWSQALPETRAIIAEAVQSLASTGARLEEVDLPPEFEALDELKNTILCAEARSAFLSLHRAHSEQLSPGIRRYTERISNSTLVSALDKAAFLRSAFDRIACRFDALLTPSAAGEAPKGAASSKRYPPIFNGLWTLLHVPCIALPCRREPNSLPLGVQLVASRYADGPLLAVANTVANVLA